MGALSTADLLEIKNEHLEYGRPPHCWFDEEQVRHLQLATELFMDTLDAYLALRAEVDPEWSRVDMDELSEFPDFYGDEITLQWGEDGHCGDRDHYSQTFPIRHLWMSREQLDEELQAARKEALKMAEAKRRLELERKAQVKAIKAKAETERQLQLDREVLQRLVSTDPDLARQYLASVEGAGVSP